MLGSTAFFNAKATLPELSLFLDIDPKNDTIKEFFFEGPKASHFKSELEELKRLSLGKNLNEVNRITRSELEFETEIKPGVKAVAPLGLSLLKSAIESYVGHGRYFKEQTDMLCLCFSVTTRDVVKKVLANKDFELKTLITETMASSACGSCRTIIEKTISDTRLSHGLIKGLDHSKSRFDKSGQWLKVAGMYPGPLLIKLEDLKNQWMKREQITEQYIIEFTHIEGLHITLNINTDNDKNIQGLLSALTEYLKSELGVLFFLKTSVS